MRATAAAILLFSALSSGLAACSVVPLPPTPGPRAAIDPTVEIDCGPIEDAALCRAAVETAAFVKLNPPPVVEARIRRPRIDDPCITWQPACLGGAVIVTIQSGDTLQGIPLAPIGQGWIVLEGPAR